MRVSMQASVKYVRTGVERSVEYYYNYYCCHVYGVVTEDVAGAADTAAAAVIDPN